MKYHRSTRPSFYAASPMIYRRAAELRQLAGDPTQGLAAARSPLKALNHLDMASRREEVARRLGLHREMSAQEWYESNRPILRSHQIGCGRVPPVFVRLRSHQSLKASVTSWR